nr:MAG: protein m33 [Herpesviridae sp.]
MTNLYFANLLTVLTLPFLILSNRGYVSSTPDGCKFAALAYYSTCTSGFATLALISINRYRVLHQKTKTADLTSHRQTYTVLGLTWLASLMCAAPAPLYATVIAHDDVPTEETGHETCIIFFAYDQVKTLLAAFKILICLVWGIAPVIMMTWFYAFFYRRLRTTSYRRRGHTLAFVCMLILSFLIIQTPFVAIMIFDSYAVLNWEINCDSINKRDAAGMLARVVPNFHCLLNPVLYAFVGTDFTKRLKQCLTGKLFNRRSFLRNQNRLTPSSVRFTAPSTLPPSRNRIVMSGAICSGVPPIQSGDKNVQGSTTLGMSQ